MSKKKYDYPKSKWFKMKDHMDLQLQKENIKEIAGILKEMAKEKDWSDIPKARKEDYKAFFDRTKDEFNYLKNAGHAKRKDILFNGEERLGKLYRNGQMAFTRREWRGIKDTAYDFYEWARMWKMFLVTFGKDLIPSLNGVLIYRWMVSYFCAHSFMDKLTMGLHGTQLRMHHELIYDIFRYVAENLVILMKADKRNGNCTELNDKLVLFDEMTMGQIITGFPDAVGVPYQLLPVFLVSEMDQLACECYIDAVEEFGLPSDTCPVPTSECGAVVLDQLPHCGCCFISSSMPCDGSVMASEYTSYRYYDLPTYHLTFPVRYDDESSMQEAVQEVKGAIRFIEEKTGTKWSWDSYFTAMKRFNRETDYELVKWDVNQTPTPALIGPAYELYRKWNYEMDGGADPRIPDSAAKVEKMMLKAYENHEPAYTRGKTQYRAIVWSCPPHYFSNFSNWLANCWGVQVLVEMESLNFTKHLNTDDEEEALKDMARLYERMVMRRHTNGGYDHVLTELWRQCEIWKPDLVIMYNHIACKNMSTLNGSFDDQAREHGVRLCWVEHDLMDPRTVSRKDMRSKVNEFMRTVMHAEPTDPTLIDYNDDTTW
ncbi:MAG: 2-hydroxyacyl-CoA dehydratase family protein [Acutalibacteraceae bacterium]|nr:2-hydroxyacyl-CoA dehydratase family protein [Acutalibacteraceae bacterium]